MNLLQMNTSMWYPWKWTHYVSICIYQAAMNTLLSKWTQKWWRLTNAFNRQKNYCNKIYKTYWKYEHMKIWVKNLKKISAKKKNEPGKEWTHERAEIARNLQQEIRNLFSEAYTFWNILLNSEHEVHMKMQFTSSSRLSAPFKSSDIFWERFALFLSISSYSAPV